MTVAADSAVGPQVLPFQPDETLDMFADMLRRSLADSTPGDWASLVKMLAGLDVFTAVMSEERGGYGGARTLAIVAEALAGQGLVTPFAMSSVAARGLERFFGGHDGVPDILSALESGKAIVSLALHEQDALPVVSAPQARLHKVADGEYLLDANKRMVAFGAAADWIIIPARNEAGDAALVLVEACALSRNANVYALIDGTPAIDLSLSQHAIAAQNVLATGPNAEVALKWLADAWAAAQCAEACGAMATMIAMTKEYLGVRKQFGEALVVNQALRHRFIEMELMQAQAATMAAAAAAAIDGGDTHERERLVTAARYIVLRAAWKVSQEAVQMHGAIGMAAETPLGGYFKRLLALSLWFGDEDSALHALSS